MGSPITFSGFNDIDFNVVLTSIMTQESQPLVALQSRQTALETRANTFGTLASRLAALESAVAKLSQTDTLAGYAATSSDPTSVAVSSGSTAVPGRYDIVVNQLARAQVTASASSAPDADTTVVASGGTLTINGVTVTLSGASTLRDVANAINATSDPPARASVVQSGPSSYRLVLTAIDTGEAGAFTVTNGLTGGTGITFLDQNGDGISGDSVEDNAVQAADAAFLVNNIAVTSSSNTVDTAVPGTTITLFRQDPSKSVIVEVAADPAQLKTKVTDLITAYNDLVKFATDQATAAGNGDESSIGRDPLLRQLRNQLRSALVGEYGTGGPLTSLSQAGIGFTRTGMLELDEAVFDAAATSASSGIGALFAGTTAAPGVFSTLGTLLDSYTDGGGLLPGARKQLTEQASRLTSQIASLQDRLAVRRAALQREFVAADQAMTLLKSQSGSLQQLGVTL